MKELSDLDPSMDMGRTSELLMEALGTLPEDGPLSGDQTSLLDLVVTKVREAEGYFDRPVDDPEVYTRLVRVSEAAGKPDLVAEFGRRTAQIEAADLEFKARLQAFFGNTTKAVELFQGAVDLTPDFQEAVDGLGRAERRVEKAKRSVRKFKDATDANPRSLKAWMDLGAALADLDEMDKALSCFANAVKLAPEDVGALCKKGGALAALGRVEEAKESFEAALAVQPSSLNAKRGINYTTYMLERV